MSSLQSNWIDPLYLDWYTQKADKAGTQEALLLPVEALATLRYNETAKIIAKSMVPDMEYRLLDIGCGYADLLKHLPDDIDYTGLEPLKWIADIAATNIASDGYIYNCTFGNFAVNCKSDWYDFVVALGVLPTTPLDLWKETLIQMLRVCKKTVIFTLYHTERYDGSFLHMTEAAFTEVFTEACISLGLFPRLECFTYSNDKSSLCVARKAL